MPRSLVALLIALCAGLLGCPSTSTGPGSDIPIAPPLTGTPELVVQTGHAVWVNDIAFSPDGALVATASADGTVKLWDTRQRKEVRTLLGNPGPVVAVAFAPDGDRVVSAGLDGLVRAWSIDTGEELAAYRGHEATPREITFAPDGTLVTADGVDVIVWDREEPLVTRRMEAKGNGAAVSPDGAVLVTGAEKALVLRDFTTGQEQGRIPLERTPDRITFDAEGRRLLVGCSDGTAYLVDVARRTVTGQFKSPGGWIRDVAFHPKSGQPATADDDHVFLYDDQLQKVRSIDGATTNVAFDPTGRLMATSGANEAGTSEMAKLFGGSRSVYLWDVKSGERVVAFDPLLPLIGNGDIASDTAPFIAAFHPSEPILATAGYDGLVRLWDLRRGGPPRVLAGHRLPIVSIAFNPRGNRLVSGSSREILVWRLRRGVLHQRIDQPGRRLAFDETGNLIFAGDSRGNVRQVDANTGRVWHEQEVHGGPIAGIGWVGDFGAFITAGQEDRAVSFWEGTERLRASKTVRAHKSQVRSLAVTDDGRFAVGGGSLFITRPGPPEGNAVTFVDTQNSVVEQMVGHSAAVAGLEFSPDGALLASGSSDQTVRLWRTSDRQPVATLRGHTSSVGSVSFSHDGRLLASVAFTGDVRIWDVAQQELVATLTSTGHEGYVMATPDHYYTASKAGLDAIAFRFGRRAVPFELFDLRLNRPDIVLTRLGYAPKDVIRTYEQAYRRRLRRMKIPAERVERDDYDIPVVQLLGDAPPVSTEKRTLRLKVRATDGANDLDRLLVHVNDVPIHGTKGLELSDHAVELPVEVQLAAGANKVQVSALNENGVESFKETVNVTYRGPTEPSTLFVLAIGVSNYGNPDLDLKYAAKDAKDVTALFRERKGRFAHVRFKQLIDREVTREKVAGAKAFLQESRIDDQVVLFVAGHGALGPDGDYVYVGSDIDLERPAETGIPYEVLEGLLDGIPARRKLMLVDTCHSGEVEEDALGVGFTATRATSSPPPRAKRGKSFRSLQLFTNNTTPPPRPSSRYGTLSELFADLRRGTGAMVISSSTGTEYSWEKDTWSNGAFTFAVLEGLREGLADTNRDGTIVVSELREYVGVRVQEITGGEQHPTTRRENLVDDFPVF